MWCNILRVKSRRKWRRGEAEAETSTLWDKEELCSASIIKSSAGFLRELRESDNEIDAAKHIFDLCCTLNYFETEGSQSLYLHGDRNDHTEVFMKDDQTIVSLMQLVLDLHNQ